MFLINPYRFLLSVPPELVPDLEYHILSEDPYYPYVSLLFRSDKRLESSSIIDNIGHNWTKNGNATISGNELVLDGNGDYLNATIPSLLGTGDFIVEARIKINAFSVEHSEILCVSNANMSFDTFDLVFEYTHNGALRGSLQNNGVALCDLYTANGLLTTGVYYDVAFAVVGTTAYLFIDGVMRKSGALTGTRGNTQSAVRIGHLSPSSGNVLPRYINGSIERLRVTKGSTRGYNMAGYTPPTTMPALFSLSDASVFPTTSSNDAQGVAVDESHVWYSSSTTIFKYTRAGALVTSRNVSADAPATKNQINGMALHQGKLYVSAALFSGGIGTSWIVRYDPNTLAYETHWTITGDWFSEGLARKDNAWWVIFHATKQVAKLDDSFNVIATYPLNFSVTGSSGGYGAGTGYDGIAWLGNYLLVNIHEIYNEDHLDVYHLNTTTDSFELVARWGRPTSKTTQGIAVDPAGDKLWFAERNQSGSDSFGVVNIFDPNQFPQWTPNQLQRQPEIWASNSSAITDVSGACSQWNDLSLPQTNFTQATPANRPLIISAGANNRRTLKFDGVNDCGIFSGSQGIFQNMSVGWVLLVFKRNSTSDTGQQSLFTVPTNSEGSSRFYMSFGDGTAPTANNLRIYARRLDGDSVNFLNGPTITDTKFHVVFATMNWSTGQASIYLDGNSPVSGAVTSAGLTSNTASAHGVAIGSNLPTSPSPINLANIEVAEIVVGAGVLPSASEIEMLIGYAAHRWGINQNLPVGYSYRNSPPLSSDQFYPYVTTFLKFNGANQSTTFTDSAAAPQAYTRAGTAVISTAQSKSGGSSGYFPGTTSDYVTAPASTAWDLGSGDFTLEAFAYFVSIPSGGVRIFGTYNDVVGQLTWLVTTAGVNGRNLAFVASPDGQYTAANNTRHFYGDGAELQLTTWHHIAVVRKNSVFYLFLDGVLLVNTPISASTSANGNFSIFYHSSAPMKIMTGTNGYIDDLRITKGVARYTTSFVPPTSLS